jgi:ketosteroid isomerase-like protein
MKGNKEILEKINEAIRNGDYDLMVDYCQDDTHWLFVGQQEIKGKGAVKKYLKDAYLAPPKFTQNFFVDGNYVIATGKISLLDENSQWKTSSYCDIWKFEDEKILELKAFVISE